MIRVYAAAIIAAAIIGAGVWVYHAGKGAGELDRLKSEIDTRERIDNALDRPDGCPWPDRLRGNC